MTTAFFFNNVNNIDELIEKTHNKEKISINRQPFSILSTIKLNRDEYLKFTMSFKTNYSYLIPYIATMRIVNDIWHCILITMDDKDGVLVMNNGYLYPKFTAIFYGDKKEHFD